MARGLARFCLLASARGASDERGYVLLEVVVGGLILALASVGVAFMFGTGQALVQAQGDTRVALSLGRQRIEQIRAEGFGQASLPDPREQASMANVPGNPGYQYTAVITGVCATNFTIPWSDAGCSPATAGVEAKLVTVTVQALDGSGTNPDPQSPPVVLRAVLVLR